MEAILPQCNKNMSEQTLKFDRPLISLDLETTGTNIATDRIVSIGMLCYEDFPDGAIGPFVHKVVNPGIPIPPEVSEIHGYTDETVAGCPPFQNVAHAIHKFLRGADLVGYNILNFDVPLLHEELYRAGITWDVSKLRVFDAGNIFKKKEPRDLKAAAKFFCGLDMEGTQHNAHHDAAATIDIFRAQIKKYSDLQNLSADGLALWSDFHQRVDLAGKIVLNDDGIPVYGFGKAKGVPVTDDAGFGRWMLDRDFTENTKQVIREILGIN